jgi:hypothetical protein
MKAFEVELSCKPHMVCGSFCNARIDSNFGIFWRMQVTLVMAYLNGNDIPDFFQLRTLITKCLGTICTISSGLPIGQEGPMVHIGAAIASSLTWMHGRFPTKKRQGPSSSHSSRLCCDRINQLSNKAFPFASLQNP